MEHNYFLGEAKTIENSLEQPAEVGLRDNGYRVRTRVGARYIL